MALPGEQRPARFEPAQWPPPQVTPADPDPVKQPAQPQQEPVPAR